MEEVGDHCRHEDKKDVIQSLSDDDSFLAVHVQTDCTWAHP